MRGTEVLKSPSDELRMTSVSPGRKGPRSSPLGSPAAWASALHLHNGRNSTHSPQGWVTKEAQPPAWFRGLTKAEHAQGCLLSSPPGGPTPPGGPAWARLGAGLGLPPAPPSPVPLLEGQGVRSEGPSSGAPLPTLVWLTQCPAPSSQAQGRPEEEEGHQGGWGIQTLPTSVFTPQVPPMSSQPSGVPMGN